MPVKKKKPKKKTKPKLIQQQKQRQTIIVNIGKNFKTPRRARVIRKKTTQQALPSPPIIMTQLRYLPYPEQNPLNQKTIENRANIASTMPEEATPTQPTLNEQRRLQAEAAEQRRRTRESFRVGEYRSDVSDVSDAVSRPSSERESLPSQTSGVESGGERRTYPQSELTRMSEEAFSTWAMGKGLAVPYGGSNSPARKRIVKPLFEGLPPRSRI